MPIETRRHRRALCALVAAALLAPAMAAPAAPAAPAPGCEMADACPFAAASACGAVECCVAPGTPARLPLEEAAPAVGPQLGAPPPVAVALVVPPPPRPRPTADERPLHGNGETVPLFTLHASFLI